MSVLPTGFKKYVLLVMRADYKGEGGIFALLAKADNKNAAF